MAGEADPESMHHGGAGGQMRLLNRIPSTAAPFMQALTALDPQAIELLKRHNLWQQVVRAEVVAAAVGSEAIIEEEREQALNQQLQRSGHPDLAALEAHLLEQGINPEHWHWQVLLPLRVRNHYRREFLAKAEARFLERKERLDRVVYSLLRVQDGGLARELYLRISGGEANFADLAHSYAEGPERNTKGIVGPVPLNQAHPALAERLRTSKPGVLLAPFQIQEWWLVARLESYTPARFDDAIAEQMAAELFEEWVQQETIGILSGLNQAPEHSGEQLPPV